MRRWSLLGQGARGRRLVAGRAKGKEFYLIYMEFSRELDENVFESDWFIQPCMRTRDGRR